MYQTDDNIVHMHCLDADFDSALWGGVFLLNLGNIKFWLCRTETQNFCVFGGQVWEQQEAQHLAPKLVYFHSSFLSLNLFS